MRTETAAMVLEAIESVSAVPGMTGIYVENTRTNLEVKMRDIFETDWNVFF